MPPVIPDFLSRTIGSPVTLLIPSTISPYITSTIEVQLVEAVLRVGLIAQTTVPPVTAIGVLYWPTRKPSPSA